MPTLEQIGQGFGQGWTIVGTPIEDNDDTGPTGEWTVVYKTPEGVSRAVKVRPTPIPGPGKVEDLIRNYPAAILRADFTPISAPADVPVRKDEATQSAEAQAAQANAARAASEAQAAADNLKRIQTDNQQREENNAKYGMYLTNAEIADQDAKGKQLGLNQQQIDINKQTASDNARNSARSNEIAAQNAATAAQVANSNAAIAERQVAVAEGRLSLEQGQQEVENLYKQGQLQVQQGQLALNKLTQQQANDVAQAQNAMRGRELAQKTASDAATLEQRKVEAQQTAQTAAQTAATTAAANVFGTERQAQTAAGTLGGNLLSNRATATTNLLDNILGRVAGFSQGSAGRFGQLGGGLQALPAGFSGRALVQGALGMTADMFGGQSTLDSAAAMVRAAAPGAELTPYGQLAMGVISQAFERARQAGQPDRRDVAAAAANNSVQNGGVVAPATVTPMATTPGPTNPAAVPGFNTYGPIMGTPGVGGPNAYVTSAPAAFVAPAMQVDLSNLAARQRGALVG